MKKTLVIISAIALSVSVFASGNPDKAAACSKDAAVKACATDSAACDAKKAACALKTDADKAACVKEAAAKKACGGGCPLSK